MEAKHDIIQATEQEYAKLRAAVHGLGEAQMREVRLGTWAVREIIAKQDTAKSGDMAKKSGDTMKKEPAPAAAKK